MVKKVKIPNTIKEILTQDDVAGTFREAQKHIEEMEEAIIIWKDRNIDGRYFFITSPFCLSEILGALEYVKLRQYEIATEAIREEEEDASSLT